MCVQNLKSVVLLHYLVKVLVSVFKNCDIHNEAFQMWSNLY